jgi:spore coat polysaccharide biosynthesis predicted glycosyltransferase SpsG/RimJ/RimL family protein N-acetyltransferase
LFIFDFDSNSGFGHMSRSLRVARALRDSGANVSVAIFPDSDDRLHELKFRGVSESEFLRLEASPRSAVEPREGQGSWVDEVLLPALRSHEAELVFFDTYFLRPEWIESIRGLGRKVAMFSDHSSKACPDALIDYGMDSSRLKYPQSSESDTLLLGPRYTPVEVWAEKENSIPPPAGSILFALGGGDYIANYKQIGEANRTLGLHLDLTFVVSDPTAPKVSELTGLGNVSSGSSGLDSLMHSYQFIVTGAGVSLLERLASGRNGLAIVTAENQRNNLVALQSWGPVESLELEALSDSEAFLRSLQSMVNRPWSSNDWMPWRSIIDGYGSNRIASALLGVDRVGIELQLAEAKHAHLLWAWANDPEVLKASLIGDPVMPSAHLEWFASAPDRGEQIHIGFLGGVPLGVVRMQDLGSSLKLSYSLAAEFRGRGLSYSLLRKALQRFEGRSVVADVKADNVSSRKVLEAVGFYIVGERSGVFRYAN